MMALLLMRVMKICSPRELEFELFDRGFTQNYELYL